MPAASEPPTLPHTFRPLGVRIAIYALGALLLVITVATWLAFPPEIRDEFTPFQKLTVIGFGVAYYACGYALARSRLVARESGLTVVNGYRTRRYEWNEVLAVSLRRGSPPGGPDLHPGTSGAPLGVPGPRRHPAPPPG